MAILTVSQLQEHIETDLGSDAIQRLADAAEQLIVREAGSASAITEVVNAWGFGRGRDRIIFTARPISSISSIKERDDADDDQTTLSADDYRQEGRRLIRLRDGTNPRLYWAQHVEVIYTPSTDSNIRELVQIDLVKLAIVNSGAKRERMGDFDFWHHDTMAETKAILGKLRNGHNDRPIT